MKTESGKIFLWFLIGLAVIALAINSHFSSTRSGGNGIPLTPPPQPLPQQASWAAQAAPKREITAPSGLSIAPNSDGSYHWTETLRPGDDLQLNLDVGWHMTFHTDAPLLLFDAVYRTQDGIYVNVFPPANQSRVDISNAIGERWRIKPGLQQSIDLTLTVERAAGFR